MTDHGADLDIAMKCKEGGDQLSDELHPWLKAKDVIEQACSEGDDNGGQESPHSGERGSNGVRASKRGVEEDQERDRVTAEDGDTAGAGNGSPVDLTWTTVV
jgi:hypothetical protein